MRISDWSSDVCSSDLDIAEALAAQAPDEIVLADTIGVAVPTQVTALIAATRARIGDRVVLRGHFHRSEEHTSELQSLMRISYAVFCLKKKKNKNITTKNHNTNVSLQSH